MREISVPTGHRLGPADNLTDVLVDNAAHRPGHVVLRRKGPQGWSDVDSTRFLAEVRSAAKGLIASGVSPGDRVALMCRTCYEWTLLDFAIWFAGAVTVPIYETSSAEQVRWILSDSAAVAVIVETAAHAALVDGVRPDLPALGRVLTVDDGAVAGLDAAGSAVDDETLEERRRGLGADSLATIIYTSGTTGRPKGCELTHANFVGLSHSALEIFSDLVRPDASTLLFLPLAHVFARYIQVLSLLAGSTLGHTPTTTDLLADLDAFKPTYLLAVPRVFEKIYNGAEARAQASGRGGVFARAAATAVDYSRALDAGRVPIGLRLRHSLFDRLLYARLRAATGGALEGAVSGGAPLGDRLGHFFRGIGIPIYEGWGLTETTAPATVNTTSQNRIGTVGRPLPGVAVRVSEAGELQVSGLGVFRRYFGDESATSAALHDGWFSTGDLGSIDDDGFVSITGRQKEILVTANGKNVAPTVLEDRLRAHPLVSQTMVVGDRRPYVGALITLDAEMLPTWLSNHGLPEMSLAAARTDPQVLAELQRAVDATNAQVSRPESIRRFVVLDTDLTEESGHLTPKQSLRRAVVMKDFAAAVDQLYDGPRAP